MTQVLVSTKYQIVIPKEVRAQMKVKVGQKLAFIVKGGIMHVVPVRPISEFRGILPSNTSLADLREKKDRIL